MEPVALIAAATGAIAGAVTGSFLNVVIHRTPQMIDAHEDGLSLRAYLHGLSWPASHCPKCAHALRWRDNVPVLSYVWLKGRCRHCGAGFGLRYLAVEIAAAALAAVAVLKFGLGAEAVFAGLFLLGLLALAAIDIEEQLLPDVLVFPLMAAGFLYSTVFGVGLLSAVAGAVVGFATLWGIRAFYGMVRGVEGMGLGDVKLGAMLGAWLGLSAMPSVLMLSFLSGVAVMLPLAAAGRLGGTVPVPFGPFLAFGGALALLAPRVLAPLFPL